MLEYREERESRNILRSNVHIFTCTYGGHLEGQDFNQNIGETKDFVLIKSSLNISNYIKSH